MKAVLQRVLRATVTGGADGPRTIGPGLLALIGIEIGDGLEDAQSLVDKVINLRIFEDSKGKLNISLPDAGGDLMLISQFTLLADTAKGRRPSFHLAECPEKSEPLFKKLAEIAACRVKKVETGWFGEKMKVELVNDGPVTIIIES